MERDCNGGPSDEFNGGAENDLRSFPELRPSLSTVDRYSAVVLRSKISPESRYWEHIFAESAATLRSNSDLLSPLDAVIEWWPAAKVPYSAITGNSLGKNLFVHPVNFEKGTGAAIASNEAEKYPTTENASAFLRDDLGDRAIHLPSNTEAFIGTTTFGNSSVISYINESTHGASGELSLEVPEPYDDGPQVNLNVPWIKNLIIRSPSTVVNLPPESQALRDLRNSLGIDYIGESTDGGTPGEVIIRIPEQNTDEDGPEIRVNQIACWSNKFSAKWSLEKEENAVKMGEMAFKIVLPLTGAANWMLKAITKHPAYAASLSTSSSSFNPSWVADFGIASVMLGFAFTLAGYGLRGKRSALCIATFQLSAFAAACGFINFMGSLLPQPLGGIVECVALLVIAMALLFSWHDPQ